MTGKPASKTATASGKPTYPMPTMPIVAVLFSIFACNSVGSGCHLLCTHIVGINSSGVSNNSHHGS